MAPSKLGTVSVRIVIVPGADTTPGVEVKLVPAVVDIAGSSSLGASSPLKKPTSSARRRTGGGSGGGSGGGGGGRAATGAGARGPSLMDWSRRTPPLSDEALGEGGALAAALRDLGRSPTALYLYDNELTSAAAAPLGQLLALKRPRYVRRLNLSGNRLGDSGVIALLDALSAEPAEALLALGLGVNGLGVNAAAALAAELSPSGRLTSLRELRLGGNPLGLGGALALAAPLAKASCRLSTLHLGSTAIGDAGGEAIALALVGTCASMPSASGDGGDGGCGDGGGGDGEGGDRGEPRAEVSALKSLQV